jgi:hypothetical protein
VKASKAGSFRGNRGSLAFGHASKRGQAMTMPGFSGETSLYETRVYYRLMGAWVQAGGVALQQFPCGPCGWDNTGACVRNCGFCISLFGSPVRCKQWTEPCDPSACTPVTPPCIILKEVVCGGATRECDLCPFYPSDCNNCPSCEFPQCCFSCAERLP